MLLTPAESQAINEIAKLLCKFLPGNPHPYSDPRISFPGVAQELGLGSLWSGASKMKSIPMLLEKTLEFHRERFPDLLIAIVRRGITYRNNKEPITREEIKQLNHFIERAGFKIQELWAANFLDSLPSASLQTSPLAESPKKAKIDELKKALIELEKMEPKARGFAFEKFLKELFLVFDLAPRSSFRLTGEQIDGSLELDNNTYLIEAKWQNQEVGNSELLILQGKVNGKSAWARGLIISYTDFSEDGLTAFSKGRSTNIIAMTGEDLYLILEGELSLIDALRFKARRAAETGQVLVKVHELSQGI